MDIGLALPQMTTTLDRNGVIDWCRIADSGPFSSISAGERITFPNLDGFGLCAAAAVLTERVRIFLNVAVLPWHSPALVAKELAGLDVLSDGRLDVAVGVGGRVDDFVALEVPTERRHQRLDRAVEEIRRLWSGGAAADGGVVGPAPIQTGGPRVMASAMGPKALARAARWADGVSGFSLGASATEAAGLFEHADRAWADAGRTTRPRHVCGVFASLGPNADEVLVEFATRYLDVFGSDIAHQLAAAMPLHNAIALRETMDAMAAAGCDELVIVPASSDISVAEELREIVSSWRG